MGASGPAGPQCSPGSCPHSSWCNPFSKLFTFKVTAASRSKVTNDFLCCYLSKDETCPRCEDGWEPHGGKCYFFSSVTLTWNESRTQCISMSGDLVVINNREEQRFLESRVRGKMDTDDKFWIGLTDSKNKGEWLWVDDTRLDSSVKFWLGNNPDDWRGEKPDGEDCVRMGKEYLMSWFDKSCGTSQKYICEKPEKA
ncbi:C-type lectin domain family 4 member E-like [Limanda limanda]|uniref:C-type lectin domain family 4 member E-like n=1 Tax=Limanda limanda TaxID=27771 RepID=UPI0029C7B2FC|nr:C-type lectin domain family 4 member E-like [Limanda limanda]